MQSLSRGVLIAVEGIDGSGKSTLVTNLAQALLNQQLSVITTKEPGGSALGKQLRPIVQTQAGSICSKAEYLLFAADRAQHFAECIIPHLAQGDIIISDRMADSSLVYQGFGRGLDQTLLATINQWAMNNIQPDLVIYVRLDHKQAYQRLLQRKKTLTAFEKEQESFFKKLVDGYDTLFKNRTNVIHLDGTTTQETVAHEATQAVISWLKTNRLSP